MPAEEGVKSAFDLTEDIFLYYQLAFSVFLGKERGRIFPGYPGIGVLTNSYVIICRNQ